MPTGGCANPDMTHFGPCTPWGKIQIRRVPWSETPWAAHLGTWAWRVTVPGRVSTRYFTHWHTALWYAKYAVGKEQDIAARRSPAWVSAFLGKRLTADGSFR